jgi:hypothetical protein
MGAPLTGTPTSKKSDRLRDLTTVSQTAEVSPEFVLRSRSSAGKKALLRMPRPAPRIEKHRDTANAASDGAVRSSSSVSLQQPASVDDAILAPWEFDDGEDDGSNFSPNPSPRPAKTKFSGGDKPKPSKRQARRSEHLRGSWTRAVRFKSRDIYTGDVPMARLGGKLMSGEGLNEIHAWIVLDFHLEDMVEAWAQPDLMKIKMFGVSHNWTPDARVARKDNRDLLIEVKPLEVLQPDQAARPEMAALMREDRRMGRIR